MMLLLTIAVPCVAMLLAFIAWRRNGRKTRTAFVESLRVALVVMAVILLWQPETVYSIRKEQKLPVILLVDQSGSMQTQDAGTPARPMNRTTVAVDVQSDRAWSRLDDRFELVTLPICVDSTSGSDLAGEVERAAELHPRAASLVLVSDGDFNGDRSPAESAADWAAQRGASVALFSVPLGADQRLPDLELVSCDVPTFGVIDKPIRIPFTVRNWFDDLRKVEISLQVDGKTEQRQTLQIPSRQALDGLFTWQTDRGGVAEVDVSVEVIEGEFNLQNNRIRKAVEVRPEALRVLIIEGTPRWEYRYLRNALVRDPGIEVSTLLFQPELSGVGGGMGYLPALPDDPAEWASYDVIFLGDVGIGKDELTLRNCEQIVGLVEQQAVGLVLMPGPRGSQASLLQSPLAELFPVIPDTESPRGFGAESPQQMALSLSGRSSLLTQLDDGDEANWQIWQSLPGFYWHAAVTRAKAGSEVLAVHSEKSNAFGRIPLLVTRPSGAGKVLFMGTDAAWRWRRGVEDKYHYRFWGQVIRWMAYQRNMAVGDRMRLSFLPESPRAGEGLTIRLGVMTSQGAPSQAAAASIEIRDADDELSALRLNRVSGEWGIFEGRFTPDRPGEYRLLALHPDSDETLESRLVVRGRVVEKVGKPARPDVMRETARVAHGLAYGPDDLKGLVDKLNTLPEDPEDSRRIQWWNHPLVMIGMLGGLTLFWLGRKWAGLV